MIERAIHYMTKLLLYMVFISRSLEKRGGGIGIDTILAGRKIITRLALYLSY